MCVNQRMQAEEVRQTPEARYISGRAVVRVTHLTARGAAVGHVQQWLALPAASDWAAVFGAHAMDAAPPEQCEFVGGLPGELLEVELQWPTLRPGRRRARRAPGPRLSVQRILQPSPDRVEPLCPVFGLCGGCQLQHLAYEQQLAWKANRVATLLRDAGVVAPAIAPPIACDEPWHYRNHMRFSVDREGRAGLTPHASRRVIPLAQCPIAHPLINAVLASVRHGAVARPQLLIRCGAATAEVLVQPAPDTQLSQRLADAGIAVHTDAVHERLPVPTAQGKHLAADTEPVTFRVRPSSFFQTNTAQAARLAQAVLAGLPTGPTVSVVDAYCGVGTFAALLAASVGRVYAVEESASAIQDARWNLRGFANVEVIQAKTEVWLPNFHDRLDGLVIDPPRVGCARPVLDALVARRVPYVVYVSCDPATLARDLAYLCVEAGAYRPITVQPLDMFPQTAHIETIVSLEAA